VNWNFSLITVSGADICVDCWPLMAVAVKIIHRALRGNLMYFLIFCTNPCFIWHRMFDKLLFLLKCLYFIANTPSTSRTFKTAVNKHNSSRYLVFLSFYCQHVQCHELLNTCGEKLTYMTYLMNCVLFSCYQRTLDTSTFCGYTQVVVVSIAGCVTKVLGNYRRMPDQQ